MRLDSHTNNPAFGYPRLVLLSLPSSPSFVWQANLGTDATPLTQGFIKSSSMIMETRQKSA